MRSAILILRDRVAGTFHAALFLERPFPGACETNVVRLRSVAHYSVGAETLEAAQRQADDLATRFTAAKLMRDRVEPFDTAAQSTTILLSTEDL